MDREVCSVVLQRWDIITSLRTDPKDKRALVDDLDCSRSTVNRAVRELESMGIVEFVDGQYVVTSLGQSIADGFDDVLTTVDLQLELEPFLHWIPDDEFDIPLKYLQDAKLLLPDRGDPHSMINHHVKVLRQTNNSRAILPLVGLHAHEVVHKQIVGNDAQSELVVTPEVVSTLLMNPDYAGLTKEMAATGRYQLFEFDGEIPYFVGILDDAVQIGVDEDGKPRALLESEHPEVRTWAKNTIEEYKEEAVPVEITTESAKAQL